MSLRVIAIDGPAASGKSSTAALVARRLGWAHLDSGALYRAITLAVLDNLGETAGEKARERGKGKGETWGAQQVVSLAEGLPVRLVLVDDQFRPEVAGVDVAQAIRSERVTQRVSEIAAIPEVRHWVNVQQRDAVQGHSRGVVVDGRDIGTVVFPDAPLKVFLTASPEERARRRLAERGGTGAGAGAGAGTPSCDGRLTCWRRGTALIPRGWWRRSEPPPTRWYSTPRGSRSSSRSRRS